MKRSPGNRKLQLNLIKHVLIFFRENEFENIIWKLSPFLFRPWHVKATTFQTYLTIFLDDSLRIYIEILWKFICNVAVNPLRAKFFRGNINIYLHFVSFLHIDRMQVVEILRQVRKEPTYST